MPRERRTFWITTDLFARDGKALAGPYPNSDAAMYVRDLIERDRADGVTYWVDSRPGDHRPVFKLGPHG